MKDDHDKDISTKNYTAAQENFMLGHGVSGANLDGKSQMSRT